MSTKVEESIGQVLTMNVDLLAWLASNMPRIDPEFYYHRLAICLKARPIMQIKRKVDPKKGRLWMKKQRNS